MAIRLSGMVSGLDTDSVVQALMSAQKYKKTKIEASKQKLEWKQELWSDMNTKIYDFYRSSLSKMRMQSTFKTKTAASSDSSKITATATSSAAEGTYRIKVKSVASAQYVTSGIVETDEGKAISTKTKLAELGFLDDLDADSETDSNVQIQFTGKNGASKASLIVDKNTTVDDFLTAAKSVGISASYDTTQKRFFFGSASSGANQAFTITAYKMEEDQANAVQDWKDAVGYKYLSSADQSAVSKIFYQLQTLDPNADDYSDKVNNYREKLNTYLEKAEKTAVTAEIKKQVTNDLNAEYFTTDQEGNRTVTEAGKAALIASGKTAEEVAALAGDSEKYLKAVDALVTDTVKSVMSSDTMKDVEIPTAISQGVQGRTIIVDGKSYSITAPADVFLASSRTDRGSALDSAVNAYNDAMNPQGGLTESDVLKGLGLENIDGSEVKEQSEADTSAGEKFSDTGMVVVAASDAEILFNGATLSSANSTLTINGLTLNVLDKTDSELTVTVSKDTSAVYDAVKDFISEYNSILKAMNTSYNAATAKGYDVLTSEMKEEMTDDEIEKWESVVKSSLLRRDDTLSSLISSFRNDMMVGYTASDGKKYSLASLGIMTSSDYTENGILHIMGDEDDDIYGDSQNKLQSMLNKNPDLVMEIMTGITGKFYEDLQKKMRTSKYSSALTFYNDKQMTEQMRQYKKEITTWEAKLADMEERYYSQFTAMEKAMANLQSQQNSLAGFFG